MQSKKRRKRMFLQKKGFDSTSKPFYFTIVSPRKKSETVGLTYFYDHFEGIEYLFFKNGSILA
jgi:hypothetical protein